ncbi:MAG: hypothetical protein A2X25_11770 [Chloroflexi bacterium GWB2_49_20]|nr:MAG: hypothetical protein A2X25_11770 [Chloroflexi bacterium GWB2_49_20]OGN77683.1 MAG: hypothetical protein A2X26_10040 [Chloroflexi bacterium GWC2_49_37]OGN86458.1 MAG: hypothetical protein A2X27_06195 [Chloroflexi bacterium GWD2_49_16]HBG74703.1 hypothetical protein [Anaerolineae bacterium]
MKPVLLSLAAGLALLLSACSPTTQKQPPVILATLTQPSIVPSTETSPASTLSTSESLTRTDQQGAVVVAVTPLNFDQPGETLDFQVSLETHSVDLGMDLVTLSTLVTDTGLVDQAILWDGENGGHHVSGTLSFPASVEGKPVLEGATKLILTIKDVDAPERVFIWDLP